MLERPKLPAGPIVLALAVAVAAILTGLSPFTGAGLEAAPTDPDRTAAAAQVYDSACASCHGADGAGVPATVVGFALPLPDFTDCEFAPREPDADWYAVTHDGGPARGFDPLMPAFGDVLGHEEITLALEHVRTFCPDPNWPRGELNLPRPLITEKAFPEDEVVFTTIVDTEGDGEVSNEIVYEFRIGPRNQVEIVVPFGWQEQATGNGDTDWEGGLGNAAVGLKRAMYHSFERGHVFSLTAEMILPTGDEEEGFGGGYAIFEPFATFGQVLPGDAFVHFQVGGEFPLESGHDDEAFARMALGKSFTEGRFGRTWSPMVEVLAARDLVSGADVAWDAVPQFQVTLNTRQHVMANFGVRIPLTDSDVRDTRFLAYILWDFFDGGFFQGW